MFNCKTIFAPRSFLYASLFIGTCFSMAVVTAEQVSGGKFRILRYNGRTHCCIASPRR